MLVCLRCVWLLARPLVCITRGRDGEEDQQQRQGDEEGEGAARSNDDGPAAAAAAAAAAVGAMPPAPPVNPMLRPDAVARGRPPDATRFSTAPSLLRRCAWEVAGLLCAIVRAGRVAHAPRSSQQQQHRGAARAVEAGQQQQHTRQRLRERVTPRTADDDILAASIEAVFPAALLAGAVAALRNVETLVDSHAAAAARRAWDV